MARLNELNHSDEDFPELSTILHLVSRKTSPKAEEQQHENRDIAHGRNSDKKSTDIELITPTPEPPNSSRKAFADAKQLGKQRSLIHSHASLLTPRSTKDDVRTDHHRDYLDFSHDEPRKSTPRRAPKLSARRNALSQLQNHDISILEDAQYFDDLSDFIVDESVSDTETITVRSPRKLVQKTWGEPKIRGKKIVPKYQYTAIVEKSAFKISPKVIDLTSPGKPTLPSRENPHERLGGKQRLEDSETASDDEPGKSLRYFPPITQSPRKHKDKTRLITPPTSPSRFELTSPTKRQMIPPSLHRPGIDAFWSQDVINDWNEHYSPLKTPKIPNFKTQVSKSGRSPLVLLQKSLQKSPMKSTVKKAKEEDHRRKMFNEKKHALATSFLKDIDSRITNGKVAALAASTGGINIIWSKKLTSTAGRANWKKENLRSKGLDEATYTTYLHHASIELAEKIIDDEDRLFNVIAHEYCHLANFMISGVKDNPHGKEFKEWARKVTLAFSHLSINVTTKHSYVIAYKYVWVCTRPSCGLEYKRHSRSIDVTSHSCGKCSSRLVQVKPVPRAGTGADGTRRTEGEGTQEGKAGDEGTKGGARGRYQEYVKTHFALVRSENPEIGMAGWMVELGRNFREERARELSKMADDRFQANIGAVNDEGGTAERVTGSCGEFDCVARKLDFLRLE